MTTGLRLWLTPGAAWLHGCTVHAARTTCQPPVASVTCTPGRLTLITCATPAHASAICVAHHAELSQHILIGDLTQPGSPAVGVAHGTEAIAIAAAAKGRCRSRLGRSK